MSKLYDLLQSIINKVKNTEKSLESVPKTVNGVEPDENGNIEVEIPDGVYIAKVAVAWGGRYSFTEGSYEELYTAYSGGMYVGLNLVGSGTLYYLSRVDEDGKMHFGQIPYDDSEGATSVTNFYLAVSSDGSITQIRRDFALLDAIPPRNVTVTFTEFEGENGEIKLKPSHSSGQISKAVAAGKTVVADVQGQLFNVVFCDDVTAMFSNAGAYVEDGDSQYGVVFITMLQITGTDWEVYQAAAPTHAAIEALIDERLGLIPTAEGMDF